MGTSLAVDASGQRLVEFGVAEEPTGVSIRDVACPLALVVVSASGGTLFGLNAWRLQWELPGGTIEHGESPRMAAHRELLEETGVDVGVDDLAWAGAARFELVNPTRTECAAVYEADLPARPVVTASDELLRLEWFDLDEVSRTDVAPLDLMIARMVKAGGSGRRGGTA